MSCYHNTYYVISNIRDYSPFKLYHWVQKFVNIFEKDYVHRTKYWVCFVKMLDCFYILFENIVREQADFYSLNSH